MVSLTATGQTESSEADAAVPGGSAAGAVTSVGARMGSDDLGGYATDSRADSRTGTSSGGNPQTRVGSGPDSLT